MLFPADPPSRAARFTMAPDALAATPTATGHRLMAAARLEASVDAVLLIAKVPLVELPQVFDPLEPAVADPQEKLPKASVPDGAISVPGVVAVIVVSPAAEIAVAPTAGKSVLQELIASLRLAAAVA